MLGASADTLGEYGFSMVWRMLEKPSQMAPDGLGMVGGQAHAPNSPAQLTRKTARALLESGLAMPHGEIKQQVVSACGTRKLLIALHDGLQVETVLIPSDEHSKSKRQRTTLCVSSQVGCARGCVFCATGKLGLTRNLTAEEILLQLFLAARVARKAGPPPVTNVVFMGEGEPQNNLRHVAQAVNVMLDPRGFSLSPRKVGVYVLLPARRHRLCAVLQHLQRARAALAVHARVNVHIPNHTHTHMTRLRGCGR